MSKRPTSMHKQPLLRFTSITLRNWKNFQNVDGVGLRPRVFLIGPNAGGKSNVLDAFKFLHDLSHEGGGLKRAVDEVRGGLVAVRSLHARKVTDVEIGVTVEGQDASGKAVHWRYELVFNGDSGTALPRVLRERVIRDGKKLLDRPDATDKEDAERCLQTGIEQTSVNKEFRDLVAFFRSIEYVNLVPQLIREGLASPGIAPGVDPQGRDFLKVIAHTPTADRKRKLAEITKLMKKVVPLLTKIEFHTDSLGKPHLVAKFQFWRGPAAKQREHQLSDGTLRLIAMLWHVLSEGGPILLDEPEWSLHDRILRKLAAFFAKAQQQSGGRQLIIATHSQSLLSDPSIGSGEIILVQPAEKGGGSTLVAAHSMKRINKLMEAGIPASEAALPSTGKHVGEFLFDVAPLAS